MALALPRLEILTVDLWKCNTLQYFQAIQTEQMFAAILKGAPSTMSAVDQLVSYIRTLSPEQVSKAVSQIPQWIAAVSEQEQLCPQEKNEPPQ